MQSRIPQITVSHVSLVVPDGAEQLVLDAYWQGSSQYGVLMPQVCGYCVLFGLVSGTTVEAFRQMRTEHCDRDVLKLFVKTSLGRPVPEHHLDKLLSVCSYYGGVFVVLQQRAGQVPGCWLLVRAEGEIYHLL